MRITVAIALLFAFFLQSHSFARDITDYGSVKNFTKRCELFLEMIGNERRLTTGEIGQAGACATYVAGVIDSFSYSPIILNGKISAPCIPDRVTLADATEVVARYIASDPSDDLPAYILVALALEKRFPCMKLFE